MIVCNLAEVRKIMFIPRDREGTSQASKKGRSTSRYSVIVRETLTL